VTLDYATRCPAPGNHEDPPNVARAPAPATGDDRWHQACLLAVLADRCLDAREIDLDLEYGCRALCFRDGEEIDRTALAVLGVRLFCHDQPAGLGQEHRESFDDLCMTIIEEELDVGTAPAHDAFIPGFEGNENPPDELDGQHRQLSALQSRDRRLVTVDAADEV
jgi:hypothetical protein